MKEIRLIPCCELLSNEYLCKIENNQRNLQKSLKAVVNCFQMSIFVR